MIVLRPVGRLGRLGALELTAPIALVQDTAIPSKLVSPSYTQQLYEKYSFSTPPLAVEVTASAPPPPSVTTPESRDESFPVAEVASKTVDGQSSSTIEDTRPEPAVVAPNESGDVGGATVADFVAATQRGQAGFDAASFWQQHKTKIIIAGVIVAAYLVLK